VSLSPFLPSSRVQALVGESPVATFF
jgi:hypothetical protein